MYARYLGILIGVWYVTAPFVWGYGPSFNWWLDAVLGVAILVLSGTQIAVWSRLMAYVLLAVGAYSMLAPFRHGYLQETFAFWNDLVFGVITVGVACAIAAAATEYGDRAPRPAR